MEEPLRQNNEQHGYGQSRVTFFEGKKAESIEVLMLGLAGGRGSPRSRSVKLDGGQRSPEPTSNLCVGSRGVRVRTATLF